MYSEIKNLQKQMSDMASAVDKAKSIQASDKFKLNCVSYWLSHYPSSDGFDTYAISNMAYIFYCCPDFVSRNIGQLQVVFDFARKFVVTEELPFPNSPVDYMHAFDRFIAHELAEVTYDSVVDPVVDLYRKYMSMCNLESV